MSEERLALPGFLTPSQPKASMRVFSQPDGSVLLVLRDQVPLDERIPDYHILVSREFGSDVAFMATVRNGMVITEPSETNGCKRFTLRIRPACLEFVPGTYTLRAMVDGCQVWFRHLTVREHPERLRQYEIRHLAADETVG